MQITIEKDGDGYLAKVTGHPNLFAFAYSEAEAITELQNVVEMVMDFHLEQVNNERLIRNELISMQERYAVQV